MSLNPKPSGRTPATAAGIEAEVTRLQKRIDELRAVQASSRRTTLVLVLVVLLEFAAFAVYTRERVVANFNQDALRAAVAERVPKLTPELRDRLLTVAQHTVPVYRDRAMQRFEQAGPEVARDALDRLQKLPEDNGRELNARLQASFEVALARLEPDLQKSFPSLSSEQKAQVLHGAFVAAVHRENEAVAKHVIEITERELKSMREVLEKFDIPAETTERGRRDREREFLHALVDVMMDGEVAFRGGGAPATRPATTMPSAPVVSSN